MTRKERNLAIVKQFESEHSRLPFDLHEVYSWASTSGLWYPPLDLAERRFVDEVSSVLREEYITADDGTRVRYYHAVTRGRQGALWANLDTGSKEHLFEGFSQRRTQSLGDCRQLKNDIDYCNRKRFSDAPMQISFNFDADLEEEEAYRLMKRAKRKAA
jgi:hypothetical protein